MARLAATSAAATPNQHRDNARRTGNAAQSLHEEFKTNAGVTFFSQGFRSATYSRCNIWPCLGHKPRYVLLLGWSICFDRAVFDRKLRLEADTSICHHDQLIPHKTSLSVFSMSVYGDVSGTNGARLIHALGVTYLSPYRLGAAMAARRSKQAPQRGHLLACRRSTWRCMHGQTEAKTPISAATRSEKLQEQKSEGEARHHPAEKYIRPGTAQVTIRRISGRRFWQECRPPKPPFSRARKNRYRLTARLP